jgi:N-dimethylarginine dimethylaminohydrolase
MHSLHITDETSQLKSVILGTAKSNGKTPKLEDAYDPKSKKHLKAGTYPQEKTMVAEILAVEEALISEGVEVLRPELIENCNQIFTRDIGFVIDDNFFISNILPDREKEIEALSPILKQINPEKIKRFPEEAHIEGGDVMPHHDYVFVGTYRGDDYPEYMTARTNVQAVKALQEMLPQKKVKSFNLRKHNTDAKNNALHLDCCFQPVGEKQAIIHENGFLEEEEYNWLVDFFGKENTFEITKEEMYAMNSNVFSPKCVISEMNFDRLHAWLERLGIKVIKVPYAEIAKQEGLLRCSTLPLSRQH